jgi:hypothetical protein
LMKGGTCKAAIVENKSGRSAYTASMFIDASGDADLFSRAGAKCIEEKNYLAYWFYSTNLKKMKRAVENSNVMQGISLEWRGSFRKDGSYTLGKKEYKGTDAGDITRFILDGRRVLKRQIEKNRMEGGSLIALPGMAQYRRTRRVDGMYRLKDADSFKKFNDSIGCTGHWLRPGIVYEIPYRSLIVKGFSNMFAVGRVISASRDAWEATRVIPPAVLTGQAAGTAAAMAVRKKCPAWGVPIGALQDSLRGAGVILHYRR